MEDLLELVLEVFSSIGEHFGWSRRFWLAALAVAAVVAALLLWFFL